MLPLALKVTGQKVFIEEQKKMSITNIELNYLRKT